MAILHLDSFDGYTDHTKIFDVPGAASVTVTSAAGRNGTNGLRFSNGSSARKNLGPANPIITGIAYRRGAMTSTGIVFSFEESGAAHVRIQSNPGGALEFRHGSTLIESSAAGIISPNVHYFIESEVYVHDTDGYVKIWVHDTLVYDSLVTYPSGRDTRVAAGAVGTVDGILLAGIGGVSIDYDDWYVYSTTGPDAWANTRAGDSRVQALARTGAGASTQLTPSAGANWQNVDEADSDEDTTYNESNTPGHLDLYAGANLVDTPDEVLGVQVRNRRRKTDAGTRTTRDAIRVGGTTAFGTGQGVATDYSYSKSIWQVSPATSAQFLTTEFPIEAGIEVET